MKKKRNLIGVCLVAVLMLALTVIGYAAGDGEAAPEYGAWCLVPPLVTIVLAFVTKQTIISMFIGIWVGATIIHHFNPIDGLIGSFTGYLVPSIADSWNAGMLIIMALIGGFMYMLSACGGAEAFGRWAEKVANNRKKSQLLAWIAPFVFIFNQGCLLVGVIMRPVTDKTHISRVKLAYITDAMGAPLVSMSPISDNGVYLVGLLAAEIGANVAEAKRAGLLHDLGKAIDHEVEGSHVAIGVELARKYKESEAIVHAIEAHHNDVEPKTVVACLVQAADAISAARPGARRENLENYIKRLEKLEEVTSSFPGVEKSYAIQAGREVRIMVKPEQVSEDQMVLLARDIAKKIEEELEYPGQIKVHVLRETKVIEYAK